MANADAPIVRITVLLGSDVRPFLVSVAVATMS